MSVQRDGLAAAVLEVHLEVVLKIGPDAEEVVLNRDAVVVERTGAANAER